MVQKTQQMTIHHLNWCTTCWAFKYLWNIVKIS